MTASDYSTAWNVYALGVVLAMGCFFWLIYDLRRELKLPLCMPVLALLITPASVSPDMEYYAPALLVGTFEFIEQGGASLPGAFTNILLVTAALLLLALIVELLWRKYGRSDAAAVEHLEPGFGQEARVPVDLGSNRP